MLNEIRQDRPADARFALCPSSILAGDCVLLGNVLAAVALDDYQASTGGTVFRVAGTFALTVIGQSNHNSPPAGAAVKPGDKLWATGTADATTNITYGLTIDKTNTGVLVGILDPSYTSGVGSGVTDTSAWVKLNEGA